MYLQRHNELGDGVKEKLPLDTLSRTRFWLGRPSASPWVGRAREREKREWERDGQMEKQR